MNYYELPEYASLAPFITTPEFSASQNEPVSPSPLMRLVAEIHRRAAAPRGYHYVANIAAAELAHALIAVKHASTAGELRLITLAVDNAGHPVSDVALYVRDNLPAPEAFWTAFHSLDHSHAA
jgi:hypothetical protein